MQRIRKLSSSITDLLSIRRRNNGGKLGDNDEFNYSRNPLHLAVVIQDLDRVRYLLDSGVCDVDEEDDRGRIPLQLAVLGSSTELTDLLIRQYGSRVDHTDYAHLTTAHLIAKHNKVEHCRLLLDAKADFVVEDKYGKTPVDLVVELGHEELLDLLIDYGIIKQLLSRLSTRLHLNTSALHLAARNGYVQICFKLLNEGFDLNLKTQNGSALHEAISGSHIQVVRLLLHLGIDHTIRDRNNKCAKTLAMEQNDSLSIFGHLIDTLMQEYPLRIYGIALQDRFDPLNSSQLSFKTNQRIWIIDRSNQKHWKGIVFEEFGDSKCGYFEPHLVCIQRIISGLAHHHNNNPPTSSMPSLRSVKDASGRATMRRQMKRVEMPDVPNVPGLQEELNRRRSRHLSNGQIVDLPLDPLSHANTQIQTFGNSALEYYAPRAASVAGSSSRASSSCADHSDLYTLPTSTSEALPHQYSTSSFASSASSSTGMPNSGAARQPSFSTFQQSNVLSTTASLLQQSHRNSTGSSSSQASSGFESSKTLNNLANSNSSGSFGSTLFTADNSPPPSIGISGTDTLRKSTTNSNRHSSAGSDTSSRPRSQCAHLNPQINIAEMISRGIPPDIKDSEIIGEWLDKMGMQKYLSLFITQGYDIPSVARLTSEDLLALGINDPTDRRRLHSHIQEWNVNDNWPTNLGKTEGAAYWLVTIGLQQYVRLFEQEGYIQMKDLENLSFEDLEDIGIKKLGHIKRICLALKKLKQHQTQQRQSTYTAPNLLSMPSLAAYSSPCTTNHQAQQQFHSPDSGFTENSSLFSTIQRPRPQSQAPTLPIRQSYTHINDYQPSTTDTPILDDLLDKPVSKLQIFSTRQIFAAENQQSANPYYHGVPSLQLHQQQRHHSPPPPAPQPHAFMGRIQPASARPSFGSNSGFNDYGVRDEWMPSQQRSGVFRSQPQTPIRQQAALSSFNGTQVKETSFMMNGLSNELNAIQLAK